MPVGPSNDPRRLEVYKKIKKIGRGQFGVVSLVKSIEDGKYYVNKSLALDQLSSQEKEGARREVLMLESMKHPLIVSYKESIMIKDTLNIIMEHCEGGDLASCIQGRESHFDEQVILQWFTQIALAIQFCHKNHIIHRDIKSQNIFLTKDGIVKLGDFGIARVLNGTHELATSVVGTPFSMSPEVCENKPYSKPSDIWAMGCVLYEMCTLKHAFNANNLLGLVWKIVQKKHPPIPKQYSIELANLIDSMLEKDPRKRPSVKEILDKPFIKKIVLKVIAYYRKGSSRPSSKQLNVRVDVNSPTERKAALRRLNSRLKQRQTETSSTNSNVSEEEGLSKAELVKRRKQKMKEEEARRYLIQAQKTRADAQKARQLARQRQLNEFTSSPINSPKFNNEESAYTPLSASAASRPHKRNPFAPSPRAQSAMAYPSRNSRGRGSFKNSVRAIQSARHAGNERSSMDKTSTSDPSINIFQQSSPGSPAEGVSPSGVFKKANPYDERPIKSSGVYSLNSSVQKRSLDVKALRDELPDEEDYTEDFTEDEGNYRILKQQQEPSREVSKTKASEQPRITGQDRANNFRNKIIRHFEEKSLDKSKFEDIYKYVKDASNNDNHVQKDYSKFGREYEEVAIEIEQLVCFEEISKIRSGP
eukprot:CAMPEP_0184481902 /NCGR_PEP_ID=MMETSP0113_2-20130426/3476_1 /TAXON_ID=91329 /ORGANISM="Norrisiella sphaerica, Strain BC52" /LENGTH=645 /DNA_ID=CAMNT_0026861339 /DNA_START=446 /DNA_END=2383 /DNA_ORIENTATION=+